jgi:hypothetical protein
MILLFWLLVVLVCLSQMPAGLGRSSNIAGAALTEALFQAEPSMEGRYFGTGGVNSAGDGSYLFLSSPAPRARPCLAAPA